MKSFIFILALFVCTATCFSQFEQAKATAETMASTFNIHGDKSTGSCFMVSKDGKQYFVTAAHLFQPSHKSGDLIPIQMLIQNNLESFTAKVYFHTNRKVDIAVLKLSEKISQYVELPEEFVQYNELLKEIFKGKGIPLDSTLMAFGMEVFFYGFPLGNLGSEVLGIKLPLIKKAIISGTVKYNGLNVIVLDGHNNLGFSGGPVVAYDQYRQNMSIVGVISGYVPEPIDVQYKGEKLTVNDNSGIIICYGRHYIEEIFTKHKKDLH